MNLLYRFELESLHWSMSGTRTVTHGPITTEKRVHVSDKRAIAEQVDHIVDEMRLATQRFVAGKALVRANLTAGLDSRGVLAFLAAAKPAELVLSTLGDESSLDVRVARRLAKMIGAEHRHSMPGPPKEPAFEAHNRLRAFTLDGMGDARKALSPLPCWNTKRNILVGGEGGEIFRGFFYQYFPSGHVPRAPEAITPTLFRWRFRRATGLPFRDPLLVKRIQERLTGSLATLAELGTSGYDTLDLFYLYERYSQWGASGERASWSRRWTPYEAKPAIFAAFLLPPPIGIRCTVSPRAVRRFLPLCAYWTPINGYGFLAFEGESRIRFRLRQAMGVQAKIGAKLDRRLSPRRATHNDARSQWIISDYTRQLLCSGNSLASSLFGSSGLNSLLEQQLRRRNHTTTLAYLVNAEEFQRLVSEARSRVAR